MSGLKMSAMGPQRVLDLQVGAIAFTRRLGRVSAKPTRDHWEPDEPMTLAEAVAIDITNGALSAKGLRTAVNNGEIASTRVAGKIWITKRAVLEAFAPKQTKRADQIPNHEVETPPPLEVAPHVSLAMTKINAEKSAATRRRLTAFS